MTSPSRRDQYYKTVEHSLKPYLRNKTNRILGDLFQRSSIISRNILGLLRIDTPELFDLFHKNGSVIDYGERQTITLREPDAYDRTLESIEKRIGKYQLSKPFVGVINDARLIGHFPLAFTRGRFISDASVSHNVQLLNIIRSLNTLSQQPYASFHSNQKIKEGVLLHNCWNTGYFHWVMETLTRLEGVEVYKENTGRKPKLIVGPQLLPYQSETLSLLGYEAEDLIHWDSAYGHVDKLVVPSMRREINPGTASPVAIDWLRETLREAALADVSTDDFSRCIYISRADAETRRVTNRDEVMDILSEYDFKEYQLTELPVKDVIALFAQAECIVAPHGAGLSDIIYTDDAAIVELHRNSDKSRAYYMLSQQLDAWYGYLTCEAKGLDLYVNTDKLKRIVEAALDRRTLRGF